MTILSNEVDEAITYEASKDKASVVPMYLISQLYENQVVLNLQQAADLEMKTRSQSSSELWHSERNLRITVSIMKEVCHRKANTNCKAFVQKKIDPRPVQSVMDAILSYQRNRGITVEVNSCGLVVDTSAP